MATFSFTGNFALDFTIRNTFIPLQAWLFATWHPYGHTP